MKNIYEQLKAKSMPVIENYHDDLMVHDKAATQDNDTPFLHWAGPNGTHIVMLHKACHYPHAGKQIPYLFGHSGREHILEQSLVMVDCIIKLNSHPLNHYYDGLRLKVIDSLRAHVIVVDYIKSIARTWRHNSFKSQQCGVGITGSY